MSFAPDALALGVGEGIWATGAAAFFGYSGGFRYDLRRNGNRGFCYDGGVQALGGAFDNLLDFRGRRASSP